MEVDLGKPTEVSGVAFQEVSYPQIIRFAAEAQLPDGSWKTLAEGGAIGPHREVRFPPATAQKFRLHVCEDRLIKAGAGVTVDELQLFKDGKAVKTVQ